MLSSFLLIPKSPSLNVPRELMKMFSGFMSRWMICILPQASRARQRSVPSRTASASEVSRSQSHSVSGVSSSIRMKMSQPGESFFPTTL